MPKKINTITWKDKKNPGSFFDGTRYKVLNGTYYPIETSGHLVRLLEEIRLNKWPCRFHWEMPRPVRIGVKSMMSLEDWAEAWDRSKCRFFLRACQVMEVPPFSFIASSRSSTRARTAQFSINIRIIAKRERAYRSTPDPESRVRADVREKGYRLSADALPAWETPSK